MASASRQTALHALMRVENDISYSNITLDNILSDSSMNSADSALATRIFYGVIEKKLLIDYNLSLFSKHNINKLDKTVLMILRMGMYQLFFMDRIPASASINESVKLCKDNNLYSASGFVNAVLRAAQRSGTLKYPDKKKSKNKYLSIKYSCPENIIRLWRKSYGDENTMGILDSLDGRAPLFARVNTTKISRDELKSRLRKSGVSAYECELSENALILENTGSVERLEEYKSGFFHIQDMASQICCEILGAKENYTVIDACSAPGGKSFTIAELMNNRGRIIAGDMYESRLKLIKDGAERLSLDIILPMRLDASKEDNLPYSERVLCDVPCSGLGIIRRKPELRNKNELGLDTLPNLQYIILCNCSEFVKKGGLLVYSTCTLNPKENNLNARRFLDEHDDFEPFEIKLPNNIKRAYDENLNELTLFPHMNNTDGFFISVFKRVK